MPSAGAGLATDNDDGAFDVAAVDLVAERVAAGERMPGLGHPVHRQGDPRTARLYAIAGEAGVLGPHLRLLQAIERAHARCNR